MTNQQDQCSRCDFVAECIDRDMTTLEEVAGIVGTATPSLHVHLVQHNRDDLLRRLTYGGQPILPADPADEVEAVAEVVELTPTQPVPEPVSCDCDAWEFDPGETEFVDDDGMRHTQQQCTRADEAAAEMVALDSEPQETASPGPDGPVTPDEVSEPPITVQMSDVFTDLAVGEILAELQIGHPEQSVRQAARALADAMLTFERQAEARRDLARLVEQRDALNAEIEALARRLGDLPEPEPAEATQDGGSESAQIRAWARAQGRRVSPHGRLPRDLVDEYRAAHQ